MTAGECTPESGEGAAKCNSAGASPGVENSDVASKATPGVMAGTYGFRSSADGDPSMGPDGADVYGWLKIYVAAAFGNCPVYVGTNLTNCTVAKGSKDVKAAYVLAVCNVYVCASDTSKYCVYTGKYVAVSGPLALPAK